MGMSYFSTDAIAVQNGKSIKGTLSVFNDEYVFNNVHHQADWTKMTCESSTVTVKAFLSSSTKPCLLFNDGVRSSDPFILDPMQQNKLLAAIKAFAEEKRAKTVKNVNTGSATQNVQSNTNGTTVQNRENPIPQKKTAPLVEQKVEKTGLNTRIVEEKKERIKRTIEASENSGEAKIEVSSLSEKAASCFLNNPYRILGISCTSSDEEANTALDKLKKLARLKALDSYKSPYDLVGLRKPVRDLSVAQNALSSLKDNTHRFFWFSEADPCAAWYIGKYRMELSRDGQEYGCYDLFLANYLYAILCDSCFDTPETWKRILNYYSFICKQKSGELLSSRYNKDKSTSETQEQLRARFKNNIFKPIFLLCERDDIDTVIKLHKYIKECSDPLLDELDRGILAKLISWFTNKEADMLSYLKSLNVEHGGASIAAGESVLHRGEDYCRLVEPVLEIVLREMISDTVRYDMIKESYRHTTYQIMYILSLCSNKSGAVLFANKCYNYCNADDKKKIRNTFGEVNIKAVDWNIPHTLWDVKGDEFFFGRGCKADYSQAVYWYHKASDAGNMYSQNSLGICYQQGKGVPQNDIQAVMWFEKAYKSGNPEGAYNLAECCFAGRGTAKNIDKALYYWGEADRLGHPTAKERKTSVLSKVQVERRNHRASNHYCHDIGFQMPMGSNLVAEVTLNHPAYVYLVNLQNYQKYITGDEFTYKGGYSPQSPARIPIPSSNHWYVVVDNGDNPITGIVSSVKVRTV